MQYKRIPGNELYEISLTGKVRKISTGKEYSFQQNPDGSSQITLFKQRRNVCLKWLGLMAHFEIYPPKGHTRRFWDVEFVETFKWSKASSGKLPTLKLPIMLNGGFKWLPNYPRYAIDKRGRLLALETGEVKERPSSEQKYCYLTHTVYDPEHQRTVSTRVHRLVAFAWVKNDDYKVNMVVNHLNGDKHDPRSINLEWCDHSDNNVHAFKEGLRSDNEPCKIRDVKADEVLVFHSLAEASAYMGLERDAKIGKGFLRETRLISGRWQLKRLHDDTPWADVDLSKTKVHGRYKVTIKFSDGRVEVFYNVRDIIKKYRVWNVQSVWDVTNKLMEMKPGTEVEIVDQYNKGPYEARNVQTGEVFKGETLEELADAAGVLKTYALRGIRDSQKVISNHQFRSKSSSPWPEPIFHKSLPKGVRASHPDKGEIEFPSWSKASKYFGVDRSVVKHRLSKGESLYGWKLESIAE